MLKRLVVLMASILVGIGAFSTPAVSKDVPRITKEELKALLDKPDLVIIDVRQNEHWNGSDFKIKGAIREDNSDVKSWVYKYPKDKLIVLYCA